MPTQHRYVFRIGQSDAVYLPDNLSIAQDKLHSVVDRSAMLKWRRQALRQQIFNMPRAGMSFQLDDGTLIKMERQAVTDAMQQVEGDALDPTSGRGSSESRTHGTAIAPLEELTEARDRG